MFDNFAYFTCGFFEFSFAPVDTSSVAMYVCVCIDSSLPIFALLLLILFEYRVSRRVFKVD